ncbi:hypothetical protein [Mesoaciditoga lauensis]|uniref:DNA-directed RNA polymerase subunit beta n=1 Tax=Mesoaciditoga lauensis TaxID=1495039 RepID=UPI00056BDC99|nr:hypothetical protein [Mesoaciditoga lauensis]
MLYDVEKMLAGINLLPFLEDIDVEFVSRIESKDIFKNGQKDGYDGSIVDLAEIRVNGSDISFMMPHQFDDGSFYIDGKEVFTPLLVIEKERLTVGKAKSGRVDLNNSFVIPMYWFAVALILERIARRGDDEFVASAELSSLVTSGYPHAVMKYNERENKVHVILRKPFFFPLEKHNLLLRNAQLRMTKYLDRRASILKRYNSESFHKKIGLIETPESKDMGLVRFLTFGAEYIPEKLKIKGSGEEFGFFTPSTLSVPFLNYSDSPRVMMGGKNMKQALIVDENEEPVVRTSFEYQNMGVNATVGYMVYKGLNFEDAIVVSEEFAKKMRVTVKEESEFIFDSDDEIDSIEKFKSIFKVREKGEYVAPSQWLVKLNNKIAKRYDIDYIGKLIEIRPPKAVVQNPKLRGKNKEKKAYSYKVVFVFEVEKPLRIGDKLMGRHGNKGVVSKILPISEMPFATINGERVYLDVILNPMGVISRMNIGQLVETSLALAMKYGLKKSDYRPFEKPNMDEVLRILESIGADEFGRFEVNDDRTSYGRINVGIQYIVRLYHNAAEKLAVRSTGPISPISGLPLHGRKYGGGQRFGEMEVWAMLSHNAINTLNTLFDIKSDKSDYLLREALKMLGYDYVYDPIERKTRFRKFENFPKEKKELGKLRYVISELDKPSYVEVEMDGDVKKFYIPTSDVIEALGLKDFFKKNLSGKFFEEGLKKAVARAISGKEGILRAIFLGKRIDYSARAVIVPSPSLSIDEVYLPLKMAYGFTKDFLPRKEKFLFERFLQGKNDGRKLSSIIQDFFAQNGDLVLLNRQPTLHRHNILSFKPKVWPYDVIGLPLLVCKGFNADFDGDQMAVYYPQHQKDFENLRKELEDMRPSKNLFDTGSGEFMLHLTQDILLGAHLESKLDKQKLKQFVSEKVNEPDFLKWLLSKQNEWLDRATHSGVTLSFYEIKKDSGSYTVLKKSKARGSDKQFKQLNKVIEIDGEVFENKEGKTIESAFVKGLDIKDYVLLSYRGINSMCDKKVNVARPGYLTRKLVETMYPLRIEDCECENKGLKVGKEGTNADVILNEEHFKSALSGRYDVHGQLLNDRILEDLWKKGYVEILSPVISNKLCQKCYGIDLARQKPPEIGEYVGVTAATAIGEKGTQRAMETFHTGKREVEFSDIEKALLSQEANSPVELLKNIVNDVYNFKKSSKKDIGLKDLKLINFELLVHAIYMLSEGKKKLKWEKTDLLDPFKRGFLSALSFESPLKVLDRAVSGLKGKNEVVFVEKSQKFLGR